MSPFEIGFSSRIALLYLLMSCLANIILDKNLVSSVVNRYIVYSM